MLSRKYRFHGRNSLNPVYKHGKTFRGEQLSLKVLDSPRRSSYRCSVVVSKKVSKSAVKRNKIRRRIYEQIRTLVDPNTPKDFLVIVYDQKLASLPAEPAVSELKAKLKIAGLTATPTDDSGHGIINKKEN